MGWMIGFAGTELPARLLPPHHKARYTIRQKNLFAQAGGPGETCCGGETPEGGMFLLTGIGICDQQILRKKDWGARLSESQESIRHLDGHFVTLCWKPHQIELFNDPTGLRTIYFLQRTEGLYFSTRLDWLASLTGPLEIDFSRFGAQWILANSIQTTSVVKHVTRLEPGGHAVIKQGRVRTRSTPWDCVISKHDRNGLEYIHALQKSLTIKEEKTWSLGLSGGFDSRVLLSLLENPQAHVWGPPDHPDVEISDQLARSAGLEQNYFPSQLPDVDACIRMLRERVGLTQAITPASAAVERQGYEKLHAMGKGVLDGGFGEIARRQLMNSIVFRRMFAGRLSHRPLSCPSTGKSDIFSPEIHHVMVHGASEQLNAAWESLPSSMEIANKADLISIRSRLPNFFGFEQNYLDNVCVAYMPYAQPSVLRALFQVPLRLRWNGRLLRRFLRSHSPSLSSPPLVKGTTKYPFRLGTIRSYAYARAKKLTGQSYYDSRPSEFITHLQEFILDTMRSSSVRNNEAYNHVKLKSMADDFARGSARYSTQLDWWLTFEMWRKVLSLEDH